LRAVEGSLTWRSAFTIGWIAAVETVRDHTIAQALLGNGTCREHTPVAVAT
jgi:hypothetical protein